MRLAPTSSGRPSAVEHVEAAQELPVVVRPLGEAEPGVEDDPLARDAGRHGRVEPLAQLTAYAADDAVGLVVGEVAHPVGVGPPVHRDVGRVAAGDDVEDRRVGEAAGDVVDDLAPASSAASATSARMVSTETTAPSPASCADDRDDAVELLGDQRAGGAGAGGLAADVEQVGAVGEQLPAVGDGGLGRRRTGRRRRRSRA